MLQLPQSAPEPISAVARHRRPWKSRIAAPRTVPRKEPLPQRRGAGSWQCTRKGHIIIIIAHLFIRFYLFQTWPKIESRRGVVRAIFVLESDHFALLGCYLT